MAEQTQLPTRLPYVQTAIVNFTTDKMLRCWLKDFMSVLLDWLKNEPITGYDITLYAGNNYSVCYIANTGRLAPGL